MPQPVPDPRTAGDPHGRAGGLSCDFCGEQVPSVRRVALDRDYERLRTPHRELYACERCSEQKERERIGAR
jgi:hypothetical protein